jgi:hypothetical protein
MYLCDVLGLTHKIGVPVKVCQEILPTLEKAGADAKET